MQKPYIIDFQTQGRSEEWKENVLTNQALQITVHEVKQTGKQTLIISAFDEGLVVVQIKIRQTGN